MIRIDWVISLVNNIPQLLSYLVPGYVFVAVFDWITFQKKSGKSEIVVLKSIVVSFIIKTMYDLTLSAIGVKFIDSYIYHAILILCCVAIAYIVSVICRTKWLNKLLLHIGIKRTTNPNIWNDVIETNVWVRVYLKSNPELTYLGQYLYGEEFEREPIIVLVNYQLIDTSGNIIIDYSQSPNEKIMLNTRDFERIELTYENRNSTGT